MTKCDLTVDEARQRFDYDPETGMLRWKVRAARNVKVGDITGNKTTGGYLQIRWNYRNLSVHRIIWLMVHGEWPSEEIDHINGDRTDNRIVNLRCVSRRENLQNLKRHRSGCLPGAKRFKKNLKAPWEARITIDGKYRYLGMFATEQEAHEAYLAALPKMETA
jgi:hypothetical protein